MKKKLLAGALLLTAAPLFGQSVIYSHDFDSFSINGWVMNVDGTGNNYWVQDQSYAGNAGASISDVPDQPATFVGGPNSTYMHITNLPDCSGFVPVTCNAHYSPTETSDNTAEMMNPLNTSGDVNVTINFWYLCLGDGHDAYGTLEYSTDDGVTWTQAGDDLVNTSDWTEVSIHESAFDLQNSLKFRFHWFNSDTGTGGDLALSVDEITITSEHPSGSNSVAITDAGHGDYCAEQEFTIEFDASGTFNPGNVFTAQLSDASGSFFSSVNIGTLVSSSNGVQTLTATMPSNASGTGYRVRVNSSDPASIGTDNGADLLVYALPNVNITSDPADGIICEGDMISMTASGATSYNWDQAVSDPNAAAVTASPSVSTTYSVTGTGDGGCASTAVMLVTVEDCAGINEGAGISFSLYPNPSNSTVTITYHDVQNIQSVALLDINGRMIRSIAAAATSIDLSDLPQGAYLVRIATDKGVSVQRVAKN